MTNNAQPTEVDHDCINDVYATPAKLALLEPELSTALPSYHSELDLERVPAEKVAFKPTTNGTALPVVRGTLLLLPMSHPFPMSNLQPKGSKRPWSLLPP